MKYYRVIKDTFLWKEGAILSNSYDNNKGYVAIEDIWNKVPIGGEYISAEIIEHPDNSDFFERVYSDDIKGKIFRTKDEILGVYKKSFKSASSK